MHSAQIKYNDRYSEFYKQLYKDTHEKRYLNKADSIFSCFKFQYWDKYENNKILDNIAHDRCRNRFCLNCQILINSYHAHKLKPIMEKQVCKNRWSFKGFRSNCKPRRKNFPSPFSYSISNNVR